jgi:perosamine synthetase
VQGNPYGKYNGNELKYVHEFLTDGGDFVNQFEDAFRNKIDQTFAIAVNSGTSALHAALVACDVSGGEVLMPALCPAMVAFAVIHAGATPVFCDVDPETHHISVQKICEKLNHKTKAVLGVSLHGLPIDWEPIHARSGSVLRQFYSIDDCAQALGAKGIGKADITCFSFEDKKHITSGSEGGMITTNNEELAMRARKFAGLGYKHMTADAGRTSLAQSTYQDPSYERFDTIGLNYRMSQIQAAVGLGQLERLDHKVEMRRAIARMWCKVLGPLFELRYPQHSYYTFPIDSKYWDVMNPWKDFYNSFIERGGDGFYAMPQVPYKEPALKDITITIHCPIAEELQKTLMLFKTNYRDLGEAERQAEILAKLIAEL